MQKHATKHCKIVNEIMTLILDRQTMSSIFRYCTQYMVSYLIGIGTPDTFDQDGNPPLPEATTWSIPCLEDITETGQFFHHYITDTNDHTWLEYASLIATASTKDGGLGYHHTQ
jgi:hypothetical protein